MSGLQVRFIILAQGLADIGARAVRVDAVKLLPDPTTVSGRVSHNHSKLRKRLTESNAAVTLDM